MIPQLILRLEHLVDRQEELTHLLSQPEVINDQKQFRKLSQELVEIGPVAERFAELKEIENSIEENKELLTDADLGELARLENEELNEKLKDLEDQIQILLIPKDPNDSNNVFLEIRAGTGGDEAALFVGDLLKMYTGYVASQGWRIEILSSSESEVGGYKEVITRVSGTGVYSKLKFESGAHRVQRVPATETQGRIHTSACTVAVMPEADEVEEVDINPNDIRVDTYRASGAGGQHVNKTDSAIRITHLPTGIVVECQDERSQHKNRARAMSILQARIYDAEIQAQQKEQAQTRKSLVGSGDRSERIRTYNYPQGRVTDHRINLTLYKLDEVVAGNMAEIVDALVTEHQAELLQEMTRA